MSTNKLVILPKEISIPIENIELNDKELFRSLGFPSIPDSYTFELIAALRQEALAVCRPRFGYQVLDGRILTKSEIQVGEKMFHPDCIITNALKKSDFFLVLVASVGSELTEWLEKKKLENDVMEMFISDVLASIIVEAISATGIRIITEELKSKELFVSNSYSPGYCGWNVIEQKQFFDLFPANFCGVTLTGSSLMLPIKSISAILGVGKDVVKKPYGCAICRKKDCYKRRLNLSS